MGGRCGACACDQRAGWRWRRLEPRWRISALAKCSANWQFSTTARARRPSSVRLWHTPIQWRSSFHASWLSPPSCENVRHFDFAEIRFVGKLVIRRSHAHTVVWECCKDDQQSQWEMLKFDPQLPLNPLSDRHQIWRAWLCHGYLSPRKNWAKSVKGFLLPIYAKYTPPMFATLRYPIRMFTTFFGSSNRLQPRPLHGF